ncbi:unnamed protein product [Dicrocoelium dendriticum]|nr:unnamed protein product [Dicrocoelium dendriticum]
MSDSNREKSIRSSFAAGCLGGIISTLALQPLDVVKTRLQAEVLGGNPNPGILRTIISVFRHGPSRHSPFQLGRLLNFWVGTVASLWRCVPGIGGYFLCLGTLEKVTGHYKHYWTGHLKVLEPMHNFTVGFIARSVMALALNPFLVAKTQIESGSYASHSLLPTLERVYRQSGLRGLYSGVVATIARDAPYSGFYFMAYSAIKSNVCPSGQATSSSAQPSQALAFCACLSALFASGITQPADVLRAQRQLMLISPNKNDAILRSRRVLHGNVAVAQPLPPWFTVFQRVYQSDGFTGLWRGLTLRLARRSGIAIISWGLYERLA